MTLTTSTLTTQDYYFTAYRFCPKIVARPFSSKKPFKNGDELREIVKKYCTDDEKAMKEIESVYGLPINSWNVSQVQDFEALFMNQEYFNEPIEDWDVSNATNFKFMFWNAHSFNQPLNKWNTKNVRNMTGMFMGAESFNQPLGDWNTINVMRMNLMFWGAYSFSQKLLGWDLRRIAKPRGMLVDTPYAHRLPDELDPTVVFDEYICTPEPIAKNIKNIPLGLSYVPCMSEEAHKKNKVCCPSCKTEVYHDEPRIRFRHDLGKDEKFPRIDQYHCAFTCLKKGLTVDQFDELLRKKWKGRAVKEFIEVLLRAQAAEDEAIAKVFRSGKANRMGLGEKEYARQVKEARRNLAIHKVDSIAALAELMMTMF